MIQANIPAQPTAHLSTSTWSREESTLATTGDYVAKIWGRQWVMQTGIFSKRVSYILHLAGFWKARPNAYSIFCDLIGNQGFFNRFAVELILRYFISKFSKQMAFLLNSIWIPQPRPSSLGLGWGEVNCKDFFWNSIFNGGAGQRQTTQVMRQRPNILISSSSASAQRRLSAGFTHNIGTEKRGHEPGTYFSPITGNKRSTYSANTELLTEVHTGWGTPVVSPALIKEDGVVSDSECRWRY